MELMEWVDLKYEEYLCQVNLIKHENVEIGESNIDNEEFEAMRLISGDHQMLMDSLGKKIEQLKEIEEVLGRVEARTGNQRKEVERDVEEIQVDLQRLQINKIVSEFKNI